MMKMVSRPVLIGTHPDLAIRLDGLLIMFIIELGMNCFRGGDNVILDYNYILYFLYNAYFVV